MLEGGKIEIGAELAIDARQQIEIEFRGHAFGIVVGGTENLGVLDQIDADDEDRARAQRVGGMAQEFRRFMRLEIADGRARKEADPRQRRDRRRNFESLREIGDDRMHRQAREIAPQLRRLVLQKVAGNVDRHIGLDRRRGAEQDARLAARAGAELDQARNWAETARRSPAHARATARSRSASDNIPAAA